LLDRLGVLDSLFSCDEYAVTDNTKSQALKMKTLKDDPFFIPHYLKELCEIKIILASLWEI
jgi:hypothetical protein